MDISTALSYPIGMAGFDGRVCRAARALLGMHYVELAERAGVSPSTVRNFEAGRVRSPQRLQLIAIRTALEAAGLVICEKPTGEVWITRREGPQP